MAQPASASLRQDLHVGPSRRPPASAATPAAVPSEGIATPGVRLLGPTDAAAYRALRLDALKRHPCAFRASFDEESGQTLEEFAARLEVDAIFGAFCDGALCGLAGLEIPQAATSATRAYCSASMSARTAGARALARHWSGP